MGNLSKLIIPSLLLLTGCHKDRSGIASTPASLTFLVAGQSNGRDLTRGYDAFRAVIPQAEFINCAVGNTGMMDWQKGGPNYSRCLQATDGHKIAAVIFIQGENDAETIADAEKWGERFTIFSRTISTDLGAPVFFARLGDFTYPAAPYRSVVREQQSRTHAGTMVSLDGIPPRENDEHYTVQGYQEIARRFAAVIGDRI